MNDKHIPASTFPLVSSLINKAGINLDANRFYRCFGQNKIKWPSMLLVTVFLGSLAQFSSAVMSASLGPSQSIANPAAVYCADVMKYEYLVIDTPDGGQTGICILPDGEKCDQWDFYAGKCGQNFSYCVQNGYQLEARSDGQDPFSVDYAVCISPEGQILGSVVQLSGLSTRLPSTLPSDSKSKHYKDERITSNDSTSLNHIVPSSFDWRSYQEHNWLTDVKNQANCGSCWAFAAVGVVEAHHNIISSNPNLDLDLAEQELVSCSGAGDCGGGHSGDALEYIRDHGIVDESCMPYTASDSACNRCLDWQDRLTRVDNVVCFVPDRQFTQQSVVSYGPLYVSMGMGDNFGGEFDSDRIYRCSNDSQNNNYDTNHAVVIVGYSNADGYWIVKNSWGSTWNGDGYFRVGYDECNIDQTKCCYVFENSFHGTVHLQSRSTHQGTRVFVTEAACPAGPYPVAIGVIPDRHATVTDAQGYFKISPYPSDRPYTFHCLRIVHDGFLTAQIDLLHPGDMGTIDLPGGDVTLDDAIDILDVTFVASRYGTNDPRADINADDNVDISDLVIIGRNLGKKGPLTEPQLP